jgi:hypothetical protein
MTQYGWGTSQQTGAEWLIRECETTKTDPNFVLKTLIKYPQKNISGILGTLRVPNSRQENEIREFINTMIQLKLSPNEKTTTPTPPSSPSNGPKLIKKTDVLILYQLHLLTILYPFLVIIISGIFCVFM